MTTTQAVKLANVSSINTLFSYARIQGRSSILNQTAYKTIRQAIMSLSMERRSVKSVFCVESTPSLAPPNSLLLTTMPQDLLCSITSGIATDDVSTLSGFNLRNATDGFMKIKNVQQCSMTDRLSLNLKPFIGKLINSTSPEDKKTNRYIVISISEKKVEFSDGSTYPLIQLSFHIRTVMIGSQYDFAKSALNYIRNLPGGTLAQIDKHLVRPSSPARRRYRRQPSPVPVPEYIKPDPQSITPPLLFDSLIKSNLQSLAFWQSLTDSFNSAEITAYLLAQINKSNISFDSKIQHIRAHNALVGHDSAIKLIIDVGAQTVSIPN